MSNNIKAISLLSALELRVIDRIQSHFITEKRDVPHFLYKVQPSLLINPDWIDKNEVELRSACFKGCITIAVTFKYRSANVRAVVIDAQEKWAHEIKALLEPYDIDVMVCDLVAEVEHVVKFIDKAWSQRNQPRAHVVSSITNLPEAWFKERCDRAIGHVMLESNRRYLQAQKINGDNKLSTSSTFEKQYVVFREPSLASIVDVKHGGDKEAEFARKSRVDLFVTGPQPRLVPLLAIEIDGPFHREQRKKDKDKIKNKILMEANIPLVRLALDDLDFGVNAINDQVVSIAERKRRIHFEQLIEVLLNKLIRILDTERIDIPTKFSAHQDELLNMYMGLVNEYRKKHLTTIIPVDVESDLWTEAECKCKDSLYEAQFNAYQHSLIWQYDFGSGIYRKWFAKSGYVIGDLSTSVDENGYASSVCVISSEQETHSFRSPKIRLQYFGSTMDELGFGFEDILHGALTEYACIQAVEHIDAEQCKKSD